MTVAALPTLRTEPSDADLLKAAARGERNALEALVRRHINLVFAAATRQCGDRHMAEDVTQAVFLILEKKAGSVRAPALAAWLHQTTRYAAANALRTARRRVHHERAAARSELTMSCDPIEPSALLPQLDDAIAALGEKDRRVVIGKYLQGLDAPVLAESLGTTPAGVQKRLERALVKMRSYFMRHGGTTGGIAITTAAVAAALATAGPSPATAAPVSLSIASASPAAAATARSVMASMLAMKVSVAAVALLAVVTIGGEGGYIIRHWRKSQPPASVAAVLASAPASSSSSSPMSSLGPVGQLQSGVTIALLGVSTNPSYKKQWWQADGSPMEIAPYAQGGGRITSVRAGRVAREFAFLCDQPNVVTDTTFVASTPDSEGDVLSNGIDKFGRSVPNVIADASDVPDKPATIRLSLATGPWKTEVTSSAGGATSSDGLIRMSAARVHGYQNGEGTEVAVTTSRPHFIVGTTRLVAIDLAGKEHVSDRSHVEAEVSGPGKVWQEIYVFYDLPMPDLRSVRLDSRPYDQWVEFQNVSLHAGQATTVTVQTSDDAVSR